MTAVVVSPQLSSWKERGMRAWGNRERLDSSLVHSSASLAHKEGVTNRPIGRDR